MSKGIRIHMPRTPASPHCRQQPKDLTRIPIGKQARMAANFGAVQFQLHSDAETNWRRLAGLFTHQAPKYRALRLLPLLPDHVDWQYLKSRH